MKFKIGDKVSFLNEKGGGVVSKILNKTTVTVTIDDGFQIPYRIEELILTDGNRGERKEEMKQEEVGKKVNVTKGDQKVYLAISPERAEDISTSDFNVWLINNTAYQLLFTFSMFKNGCYKTLATGKAPKFEKLLIETIDRRLLDDYTGFKTDVLFYSDTEHEEQKPVSELVKLKPVKFYKENAFKMNNFIAEKAMVLPLSFAEKSGDNDLFNGSAVFSNTLPGTKTVKQRMFSSDRKQSRQQQDEMEVDLHIEELLEDYSGMSNYEMLRVQLDAFQKAMDEAMDSHSKKLIVIHGVGTGKLKTEIRNLLATFPHVRFYDAPYSKYGFGATTVEIGSGER